MRNGGGLVDATEDAPVVLRSPFMPRNAHAMQPNKCLAECDDRADPEPRRVAASEVEWPGLCGLRVVSCGQPAFRVQWGRGERMN